MVYTGHNIPEYQDPNSVAALLNAKDARIAELEQERDTYESAATRALNERDRLREAVKDLLETDSYSAWEMFLGESRYVEIKALAGGEG